MVATGAHTWTFTTANAPDTTPPSVSSTNPADDALGVTVNAPVTATFSEAVAPATVTTTSFTLRAGTTSVAGSVSANGATVTFTPTSALPYNTACTATLASTITDLAGNRLGASYSWTFTTGSQADTTPPTVVSTTPADRCIDGTFSIATNTPIQIDGVTGQTKAGQITINGNAVTTFNSDGSVSVSVDGGAAVVYSQTELDSMCAL